LGHPKQVGRACFSLLALLLAFGAASQAPAAERVRSLKEIREEGVVLQRWDTSCAAAALATVLTYSLGDPVSEQTVAQGMLRHTEPLRVRYRGGFSMLDMKRYAEERGYQATGFRGLSFDDLVLFDGAIVPVNLHGYNHYVVFKGFDGDGDIWLGDPAFGNRTMSRDRFENVWMEGMAFVVARRNADETQTTP
jgi:predicted double-glycine peptidase